LLQSFFAKKEVNFKNKNEELSTVKKHNDNINEQLNFTILCCFYLHGDIETGAISHPRASVTRHNLQNPNEFLTEKHVI
jgi:hypothetical protein